MKVFGNGFIASLIKNNICNYRYDFYAKGVSNSVDLESNEINRDIKELKNFIQSQNSPFFYISSSENSQTNRLYSKYYSHKENCEKLVLCSKYGKIIRMPQIVGNKKSKTALLNYFASNIFNSDLIILHKGRIRYPLLGSTIIECLLEIEKYISMENRIIDLRPLFGIKTEEILKIMSNVFEITPKIKLVESFQFTPKWSRDIKYLNESFRVLQNNNYCREVVEDYCRDYLK
tara:strand:- start:1324 stop:2019 length:696 start_codon:yes stop_codon:yes gene_type:complete